jgi:hypothetical protein
MPLPIQLDLFREIDDLEEIRMQMQALKESQDKVRKKLFAEHGKLAKMYIELFQEFESWKAMVAKGYKPDPIKIFVDENS